MHLEINITIRCETKQANLVRYNWIKTNIQLFLCKCKDGEKKKEKTLIPHMFREENIMMNQSFAEQPGVLSPRYGRKQDRSPHDSWRI